MESIQEVNNMIENIGVGLIYIICVLGFIIQLRKDLK